MDEKFENNCRSRTDVENKAGVQFNDTMTLFTSPNLLNSMIFLLDDQHI